MWFTFYLARCPPHPSVFLEAIYAEFGPRRNAQCQETCLCTKAFRAKLQQPVHAVHFTVGEIYFSNNQLLVTHSI